MSKKESTDKAICGAQAKSTGEPCQRPAGWGTDSQSGKCKFHGGASTGAPKNNNNAQSHGLHTSAETFFANAEQHHLDTYYAIHESLCTRYEELHGLLPYHIKKDLSEIAFEMAKLDMAKEYEAENAADPSKPITEKQTREGEHGRYDVEVVSKVEGLKTDIRRENRLALKDMGIYQSPEKEQAQATETLADVLSESG